MPHTTEQIKGPVRLEVPFVDLTEQQWKFIILDADDSLDLIVHYPTGEREAVFSIVKDQDALAREESEDDE